MDVEPESLARMDPRAFERLALDALRAHLGAGTPVRAFGRGYGVPDGGYDGEILADYRGLAAPIAVEVKRSKDATSFRDAFRKYFKRPGRESRRVVFLTSAALHRDDVEALEESGRIIVHGAGDIAGWVRDHPYLASSYNLRAGPSWAVALGSIARPERTSPRFATERKVVEEAHGRLGPAGTALVLSAERGADLESVVQGLWGRVDDHGDPLLVPLAVPHLPDRSPHQLRGELIAPLGRGTTGVRFLLGEEDTRRLGRLLEAVPAAVDHAWVVPTIASRARGVRRVLEGAGLDVTEVRVPRVPLGELRAWAREVVGPEDAGLSAQLDDAVLDLRRGDLVALYVQDHAHLPTYLARALDPEVLEALAWVGLLQAIDGPTLEALEAALGRSRGSLRTAMERAVAAALIDHQHGAWRPVGPGVGAVGVLALLQEGGLSVGRLRAALDALPGPRAEQALEVLHDLGGREDEEDSPRHLASRHLDGWDDARCREALLRRPRIFGLSDAAYNWALEEMETLDEARRGVVVPQLVPLVSEHPKAILSVAEAVAELRPEIVGEPLVKQLLAPSGTLPSAATRLLRWLHEQALDPYGLLPRANLLKLCRVGVEAWLSAAVERRESHRTSLVWGSAAWRSDSPAVVEAWTAATELLRGLIDSDVSDVGWTLLPRLGRSPGPRPADAPPMLAGLLRNVVVRSLPVRDQLVDLVDRGLADACLTTAIGLPWARGLARDVVAGLHDSPLDLAFRAFALSHGLVVDKAEALRRLEEAEDVSPWRVLRNDPREGGERAERIADRLVASGAGADDLLALLDAAARLHERARAPGVDLRPYGTDDVLTAWCARAPEVFEPLVMTDRWRSLPESVRWRFVSATAGAFAERWSEVLKGETGPRRGIAGAVRRLLRDPASVKAEEALALLRPLQQATTRANLMVTLHAVAAHPDAAVRESTWWWLSRSVRDHGDVDRRDIEAVVRVLMRPPHGLGTLGRLSDRDLGSPAPVEEGSAWEAEVLDALDAHLALGREALKELGFANTRHDLRRLFGRLLRRDPAAWWRHAPVLLQTGGSKYDADDLLDHLDDDDLVRALQAGPATPARRTPEAEVHDFLVRHLGVEWFEEAVRALVATDPDRAVSWLVARGVLLEALPATLDLLSSKTGARLTEEQRRALVEDGGGGGGTYGVWRSWTTGEPAFVEHWAFEEPPADPPITPAVQAYLDAADAHPGLVGDTLREMAERARRR